MTFQEDETFTFQVGKKINEGRKNWNFQTASGKIQRLAELQRKFRIYPPLFARTRGFENGSRPLGLEEFDELLADIFSFLPPSRRDRQGNVDLAGTGPSGVDLKIRDFLTSFLSKSGLSNAIQVIVRGRKRFLERVCPKIWNVLETFLGSLRISGRKYFEKMKRKCSEKFSKKRSHIPLEFLVFWRVWVVLVQSRVVDSSHTPNGTDHEQTQPNNHCKWSIESVILFFSKKKTNCTKMKEPSLKFWYKHKYDH